MRKRGVDINVPLTEKRLLNITEFCVYTGLGKNKARILMDSSGCCIRIGKRLFADRLRFDKWCDEQ